MSLLLNPIATTLMARLSMISLLAFKKSLQYNKKNTPIKRLKLSGDMLMGLYQLMIDLLVFNPAQFLFDPIIRQYRQQATKAISCVVAGVC